MAAARTAHRSMKTVLILTFTGIVCLLTGIIFWVCYHNFSSVNLKNMALSRREILLQVSDSISHVQSGTQILSNLYYYNDDLDTIIQTNPAYLDEQTIWQHNNRMKTMDQLYDNAMINFDLDYYSVFIADNGYRYTSLKNRKSYDYEKYNSAFWTEKLTGTGGNLIIVSPYLDVIDGENVWVISFARLVRDANARPAGILLINVKERSFYGQYANITEASQVFVVNDANLIISATNPDLIGKRYPYTHGSATDAQQPEVAQIDGEPKLITACDVKDTDLHIIEHIPLEQITAPLHALMGKILPLVCLFCLISAALGLWATWRITQPLQTLCGQLERVSDGNFDILFDDNGWSEVRRISSTCQMMLGKIKSLFEHVRREESEKRVAELRALQAQINPHFIYNTLFCIQCMVEMQETTRAAAMLRLFTATLRNVFRCTSEFSTVGELIQMQRDYCALMQYRYPNRFQLVVDVPEELQNYRILRFVLQPLVENAIFHGIVPSEKPDGLLTIRIRRVPQLEALSIEVIDNGVGMTPERQKAMMQCSPDASHIGVYNVSERLKLYFDVASPLQIHSAPGQGTTIRILHPILT